MDNEAQAGDGQTQPGFAFAPIHPGAAESPLTICVLVRDEPDPAYGSFILLRSLPGASVYLGALCDHAGRVLQWMEIWVQTLEFKDWELAGSGEQICNHFFDERWISEQALFESLLSHEVVATGMERRNPSPLLIQPRSGPARRSLALTEATPWKICQDDALLAAQGLPPYSTSPFRYLFDPTTEGAKTFVATTEKAPSNSHVQGLNRLSSGAKGATIFNPRAGLLRVTQFHPLALEDYLQILEGRPWSGGDFGASAPRLGLFPKSIYAALESWSARPQGLPFLLHGTGSASDRLNEIFFLKLSLLRDVFAEVRAYVKAQQLPMLNLSPASFRVSLPEVSEVFPAFWAAKAVLVKPGQAYPLKIKSTEQRYFIRLGQVEPSPFLPEGLAAHTTGVGSVFIRSVANENDGVVLDGRLVAEDYLAVDPHDLLWFRLPLADERVDFFAHVYTSETDTNKSRETRFRTVPAKLGQPVEAALKRVVGTVFPRSPYEIWPLLSSPCDLFSLGVIAVRVLLANAGTNLAVILDETLSLARLLGKQPAAEESLAPGLWSLLEKDRRLLDVLSPHSLTESSATAAQARAKIHLKLWVETMAVVLRLFPGSGAHSFCKDFGDVSPLALETVFDAPIQELEALLLRLRSTLAPSLSANEEIAAIILELSESA
jgi:hypothetical protein